MNNDTIVLLAMLSDVQDSLDQLNNGGASGNGVIGDIEKLLGLVLKL